MPVSRVIFHADMDAFYASVEQRDQPRLKGQPVIVGALPGHRGVVCASSYEARRFGVRSAMPVSEAYRRCPQGVFLPPRMEHYGRVSEEIVAIFCTFTPVVEQISIDEAFLEMTGTEKIWGPPRRAADTMAARIEKQLELTVSIGIAPNKFLAKLASDLQKPRGITIAPSDPAEIIRWLAPFPVGKLWGVGEKTRAVLEGMGIRTTGDLQKLRREEMVRRFGAGGAHLYELCRGIDGRTLDGETEAKSVSRENTFPRDTAESALWRKTLLVLADEVAAQCRAQGLRGRTVVLSWRRPDFHRHSRRRTLDRPTDLARTIHRTALELLREACLEGGPLRLLGVGVTGFDPVREMNLLDVLEDTEKIERSEGAMDRIRSRFGDGAIRFGGEI